MIKLNNKNITYVALADSNNSLKAPKEIWYADSNNSVKLVYRRKDALIDGVDYEKYHWLDGDGTAYIDTGIIVPNEIVYVKTKIINTSNVYSQGKYNSIPFSNREGFSSPPYVGLIQRRDLGIIYNDINYPRAEINYSVGDILDVDVTTSRAQIGEATLGIFDNNSVNFIGEKTIWDGKISNFGVESLESAFKISLIPCKLLKPVPKWLDANGIRRQVGECGMIDLVSGKFYGNVNSVGTFTVENYYERKEWLQGRNGAYINTNHKLKAFDDRFEVHARYDGTIKNPSGREQNIFGYTHLTNGEITEICRAYINTSGRISCNYYTPDGNWSSLPDSQGITDITLLSYVESTIHTVVLNGTTHTLSTNGMQSKEYGSFIALFTNNGDDDGGERLGSRYFHGDIAYFKITDTSSTKMNLIPCTLTMDLPASMDANNIARTKGTSGMWDLVSDRFYGNVANSGTFKAVNLAEGVDYEVHQWLKAEVPHSKMMLLPLDSYDFEFERKYISLGGGNSYYFIEGNRHYYTTPSRVLVRIAESSSTVFSTKETFEFGESIIVHSTNSSLTFNSVSIPLLSSPIARLSFASSSLADEIIFLTSSITVDGIERYIPVKLLRSIPSTYDANGIARQAGECGMYDTVNDVFYGNVASDGTFSVSDDN